MIYAAEMGPDPQTPGIAVILRLHEIDQLMVSTTVAIWTTTIVGLRRFHADDGKRGLPLDDGTDPASRVRGAVKFLGNDNRERGERYSRINERHDDPYRPGLFRIQQAGHRRCIGFDDARRELAQSVGGRPGGWQGRDPRLLDSTME